MDRCHREMHTTQVMMKRGWRIHNGEIDTHRLLYEQVINESSSHNMFVLADTHLKPSIVQNTSKLEFDGVHSLYIRARLIYEARAMLHRMFVTLGTGYCSEDKRTRRHLKSPCTLETKGYVCSPNAHDLWLLNLAPKPPAKVQMEMRRRENLQTMRNMFFTNKQFWAAFRVSSSCSSPTNLIQTPRIVRYQQSLNLVRHSSNHQPISPPLTLASQRPSISTDCNRKH